MQLNPANKEIAARQKIEVAIVKQIVADALKAGYTLSVDDGGEWPLALSRSTDAKAVLDALINTDLDTLILERVDAATGARSEYGWVRLVYGNDGWDVINDYTLSIEDVLAGANALAEKLEAKAR
jgi:hypothetical protein